MGKEMPALAVSIWKAGLRGEKKLLSLERIWVTFWKEKSLDGKKKKKKKKIDRKSITELCLSDSEIRNWN